VIELLTPPDEYTPEYNAWLAAFAHHVFPLAHINERYLPPEEELARGECRQRQPSHD
jgi:hypothetical protein